MHPPPFLPAHRLSDWPECRIEVQCCGGTTILPVRYLTRSHGDLTFSALLARLRCRRCGGRPAPVWLCAGHRQHTGGAPPDWAIELRPAGLG